MSDDLISRQAAIDALNMLFKKQVTQFDYEGYEKADEKTQLVCDGISYSIGCVLNLPSAQPEQSSEIQDILEYLDTVLHPLVSPDHWNVYSELHDMISMLPSTQPQPCKDAVSKADVLETYAELYDVFDDNKEIKNELHKIYDKINALQAAQPQRWIPMSERMPENGHYYLWCSNGGNVQSDYYWDGFENGQKYGYTIVAWMPLPEPYKEGE